MFGGEQQGPLRAGGERHERRALGAHRVHDREGIRDEFVLGVGRGVARPVGSAVATSVEGKHPEVPREVVDLRLPVPRVDDRPGWQEKDGSVSLAKDLVEETDAVPLDVVLAVGLAGPHAGPPAAVLAA